MTDKVNVKVDLVTPLKETFEQKSKKKTSFGQTPSDDNYPSEKLVKTELDKKLDGDKVDSSFVNNSENPVQSKVIKSALDGKANASDLNNYILTSKILSDISTATDNTQVVGAKEMKDELARVEGTIPTGVEVITNKKSSWSGTPNDTNYPTEKLVKDSLDDKLDDSQLVTSISNLSDNTHIPSAKAVYDYVVSVPKWTTAVYPTFADLPSVGAVGTFYLVPKTSSESHNEYDEYFWNDALQVPAYEHFGAFTIDISNLVTLDDVLTYINQNATLTFPTSGNDAGYLVLKIT